MKLNVLHKKISGIYCIRNLKEGKIYIGKTCNVYNRIQNHIGKYKNYVEDTPLLYEAMQKFGIASFEYFILEECSGELEMSRRELYWQKELKSLDSTYGYNLRSDSDSGMVTHDNTRKKISSNLKDQWKKGIRRNHSNKLSKNWAKSPDRKLIQADILRKNITKYIYLINGTEYTYKQLQEKNLHNVQAKYHVKKTDKVLYKGYVIERKLIHGTSKKENQM